MPSRREMLAGVTGSLIGLSGCAGVVAPNDDGTRDGSPDDESFEGYRRATLGAYPASIEEPQLEFTPVIRSPEIDVISPAFVELYIKYVGDEPIRSGPPIHQYSYPIEGEGITLWKRGSPSSPHEETAVVCLIDEVPTPDTSYLGTTDERVSMSMDPGDTHIMNYMIAMDWDVDECFPPGTYRFNHEPHFRYTDRSDHEGSYTWNMEITIQ